MTMSNQHFSTRAIREQMARTPFGEHSMPLFLTSSFTFESAEQMRDTFSGEEDGLIYSRYSNPNTDELIGKICSMEGAEAGFATASGMSAVFASLMAFLRSGDHVVATRALFGSTHQILTQLLPRWGITHTYIEADDPSGWAEAVRPNSRLLMIETPSNPGLQLVDLEAAAAFAKAHNLIFIVDNCFATPYLQRPIDYGADLIVHSATKWIDGQGRVLGGLLAGRAELIEQLTFFCRHTGPAMSPFNAWLLSKSLETLAVRLEAHCRNALTLAEWLEQLPRIEQVSYPFLPSHPQHDLARRQMRRGGGLVTFTVEGGAAAAMHLINNVQLCSRSSNLGDTRTIVTHPASTTHSKLTEAERLAVGITPGLVRVSVGLEDVEDVIADLEQAMLLRL